MYTKQAICAYHVLITRLYHFCSSEVADSFWSWLVDSLEVVTTDCPAHCTNKQKEIVQGV